MSEVNNNQAQDLSELLQIRRDKLADLQRRGKDPFKITKYDVSHHSEEVKKAVAELEGKTVSVAGRMMSKRVMGKASFCTCAGSSGQYPDIRRARHASAKRRMPTSRSSISAISSDVKGEVFVTKTGEIIHPRVRRSMLLSKSLTDTAGEISWPDRYVDTPLPSEIYRPHHEPRRRKTLSSSAPR